MCLFLLLPQCKSTVNLVHMLYILFVGVQCIITPIVMWLLDDMCTKVFIQLRKLCVEPNFMMPLNKCLHGRIVISPKQI